MAFFFSVIFVCVCGRERILHPATLGCSSRDFGGGEPLLDPEGRGGGAVEDAAVDAAQAEQVEQDGEQHHQEAGQEQVMVVHEGEAPPVGVDPTEILLLDVPGKEQEG